MLRRNATRVTSVWVRRSKHCGGIHHLFIGKKPILLKHRPSAPQLYQSNIQPRETSAVLLWACMFNISTKIAAPPYLSDCGLVCDSGGDPLLLLMSRNQHTLTHMQSHWYPNPLSTHVFMCSTHRLAHTHTLMLSQGITTCPSAKFLCKHLDASMMLSVTLSTQTLQTSTYVRCVSLAQPTYSVELVSACMCVFNTSITSENKQQLL